ncbi:MAG: ATP-binding protein, partial [Planctomycetota bacterium]|jgi:signal transduction histidine kinase
MLEGASGLLVVRIRDDGPGIPPGIQDRIFDPFFSTRGDDRGMGLAIAYTIVRNHGGELRIRSRPPSGTSVMVLLPSVRTPVRREPS